MFLKDMKIKVAILLLFLTQVSLPPLFATINTTDNSTNSSPPQAEVPLANSTQISEPSLEKPPEGNPGNPANLAEFFEPPPVSQATQEGEFLAYVDEGPAEGKPSNLDTFFTELGKALDAVNNIPLDDPERLSKIKKIYDGLKAFAPPGWTIHYSFDKDYNVNGFTYKEPKAEKPKEEPTEKKGEAPKEEKSPDNDLEKKLAEVEKKRAEVIKEWMERYKLYLKHKNDKTEEGIKTLEALKAQIDKLQKEIYELEAQKAALEKELEAAKGKEAPVEAPDPKEPERQKEPAKEEAPVDKDREKKQAELAALEKAIKDFEKYQRLREKYIEGKTAPEELRELTKLEDEYPDIEKVKDPDLQEGIEKAKQERDKLKKEIGSPTAEPAPADK